MSSEARGATFVPKMVVGVAIGAVSPIRVVLALEVVIAVVNVVVIIVMVVIGMVSDTSDVVGTCCKYNQLSSKGRYMTSVFYVQYDTLFKDILYVTINLKFNNLEGDCGKFDRNIDRLFDP